MRTRAVGMCEKILKFCLTESKCRITICVNIFTACIYSHCVMYHNIGLPSARSHQDAF